MFTHVNCKGKISSSGGSEEGWTSNNASCRTVSLTHYLLSYSGATHEAQTLPLGHQCGQTQEEPFIPQSKVIHCDIWQNYKQAVNNNAYHYSIFHSPLNRQPKSMPNIIQSWISHKKAAR